MGIDMTATDNRTAPWTFVLDEPLRILVADDDPLLREFASVYLATPSTTIETACNGAEARDLLSQNSYDMLLLDIEMPELDGFSLLREMRSDDRLKHLPVIMLTGHDDIASIDRAYNLGANLFATKPVNWRQLSYLIRSVVRTSRFEYLPSRDAGLLPATEGDTATPVSGNDIGDFLHTVVDRADAIEAQLTAEARTRYSEPLRAIRSCAMQALTECFGPTPRSATDDAARTGPADRRALAPATEH
jgi:DNA-binding response OmpR family regulator